MPYDLRGQRAVVSDSLVMLVGFVPVIKGAGFLTEFICEVSV